MFQYSARPDLLKDRVILVTGAGRGIGAAAAKTFAAHGATVLLLGKTEEYLNEVYDAIEATGARMLFLPPYSPDFNPIEMAFAKLKALLRGVAARTIPALWQAIAAALDRFSPHECQNYFITAGYEPE